MLNCILYFILIVIIIKVYNYSGREAPSLKMGSAFFLRGGGRGGGKGVELFEIAQYGPYYVHAKWPTLAWFLDIRPWNNLHMSTVLL